MVFASDRTGNYEIWIADAADGSNARQLTDLHNFHAGSPRFSPDGKSVAFDAQINGNGGIFVISADGGEARPLFSPSFYILYSVQNSLPRIERKCSMRGSLMRKIRFVV